MVMDMRAAREHANAASYRLRSTAVDTRAPGVRMSATDELRGRDDLLLLADLTLADYLRYLARYGGATLEEDGLLLFAGAHRQPNPYRNGALRLDQTLPAQEVFERAGSFFAEQQRSYALWVREDDDGDLQRVAVDRGLRELERLPEMVLAELPPHL